MNAKRTARIVVATISLLAALGLLAAGCRPGRDPVSPVTVRCGQCISRKCATEALACDTDQTPSNSGDGKLCGCREGARGLGYSPARTVDHCGPVNALSKALESCIDDNCAARCPFEP
jgi:hypothetical protein